MLEVIFLLALSLIWIIFAVVQDLRKREIANWLNFSLVIFALVFRFFYSMFNNQGYNFFFQGVLGFIFFLIVGNLLYYGKVFAGGDAKLMIGLGAIVPFSSNFLMNVNSALMFLLFFLVAGAFYGVILAGYIAVKNRKRFVKEFLKEFRNNKKVFYVCIIIGIILVLLAFVEILFLYLGVLVFIAPYVYYSAKSIDEACMIRKVNTRNLTEGDWLYKNMKIGRRIIEAKWSGLSQDDIIFLRKKKKDVLIREGIPFSPVFLISYVGLIYAVILQKIYLF